MKANSHEFGQKDRNRIELQEDYDLQYWTEKFGVTPQELKTAVNSVGLNAQEVETYLSRISRRSSW